MVMIQNIGVTGIVIIALRKTDLHQMMFPNQLTARRKRVPVAEIKGQIVQDPNVDKRRFGSA
ncbi:hypothetical protein [Peribacillus frigoritolerans]